jgi:hypothetical protein
VQPLRDPKNDPLNDPLEDGDWPVDPGRPWALRLLALLGAFSFVMLGLTSLLPLLQPTPNDPQRQPQPLPGQPQGRA